MARGRIKAAYEEAKLARAVSLPKLARQVQLAARVSQQYIDPSRVFIASVYDVLHKEKKTRLTLGEFKQALLLCMRRGYIVCTRADLVGVLDDNPRGGFRDKRNALQTMLDRSEIEYLGATWHLVATDRHRA